MLGATRMARGVVLTVRGAGGNDEAGRATIEQGAGFAGNYPRIFRSDPTFRRVRSYRENKGRSYVEFDPYRFLRSSSNGSQLRTRLRYETQCRGMARACVLRLSPGQFTRFHPRVARRARDSGR